MLSICLHNSEKMAVVAEKRAVELHCIESLGLRILSSSVHIYLLVPNHTNSVSKQEHIQLFDIAVHIFTSLGVCLYLVSPQSKSPFFSFSIEKMSTLCLIAYTPSLCFFSLLALSQCLVYFVNHIYCSSLFVRFRDLVVSIKSVIEVSCYGDARCCVTTGLLK